MRWPSLEVSVSLFNALIVLGVYTLTAYPGLSFWDSGEWIVSCYSLQIPHAPGAPLYSLIGRLFAMLGSSNLDSVVFRINLLSVVAGSTSVFFFSRLVFSIATFLISRVNAFQNRIPIQLSIVSALLGGLMLGFSDTFWRNATEAEVYTLSACLFLGGLLFAWKYGTQGNIRYFLLSCFLAGAGLCVHPTNILLIPLLSALWAYRRILNKDIPYYLVALAWGVFNAVLCYWIMSGLTGFAIVLDVWLAGESGLGFSPGIGIGLAWVLSIGIVVLLACLIPKGRIPLLGIALLLLGLVFYALIPIRSDAPMNLGQGPDAAGFNAYYTREDFGKAPLFSGYAYNDKSYPLRSSKWVWNKSKKSYFLYSYPPEVLQDGELKFLPRMHSKIHKEAYNNWRLSNGYDPELIPTLDQEIRYLLSEQMGRYFLKYLGWNFIGRKNDRYDSPIQGVILNSSSDRGQMPLFFLPLILTLLGGLSIILISRVVSVFWLLGFIISGPALVIVLNITPEQVRERDYVFQICMLFGFIMTAMAPITIAGMIPSARITLLKGLMCLTFLVPLTQFLSAYPSHQKSTNTSALDFATLLLESCPPNTVLITAGDNDTFPLWCAQEVLGIRKDVSVVNLNLLQQPWYYRRLEKPDRIGHFQLNTALPDSLDFYPVLTIGDNEMSRFTNSFRSKDWEAPAVWMRYEYLLSSILADIADSGEPQVVVFSPLCQAKDLLNLRPLTILDGLGRFLYFNTNPNVQLGAYHFLRISRSLSPWNPDRLNYTERAYHKLIRKKGLMHAESFQNQEQILTYLKWIDYFVPPDILAGPIQQNLRYAALLDSCDNRQTAYKFLADFALQSAQNAHSEYSHELNCQEIKEIESLLQDQNPFFHFELNWFPEKHPHPCAGN